MSSKPKASKTEYEFKLKNSFEIRQNEALRIINKHLNSIPIIVEKSDKSAVREVDRNKFIMARDIEFSHFIHAIRTLLKIMPKEKIYFFIDNDINNSPHTTMKMGDIYDRYKDKDKFLYITYSNKNHVGL